MTTKNPSGLAAAPGQGKKNLVYTTIRNFQICQMANHILQVVEEVTFLPYNNRTSLLLDQLQVLSEGGSR